MTQAPIAAREIVVIGGGCYGDFYTRQLEAARSKQRLTYRRLLVVDRDPACRVASRAQAPARELVAEEWGAFLDRYLADPPEPTPPSYLVPSPLMPHLLFEWLLRRARSRWPDRGSVVVDSLPPADTPYETLAPDGTRYVSYADWLCPTHCIEPATCPVTRAPRTWEVTDAADRLAGQVHAGGGAAGPVLFHCRHLTFGVGVIPVAQLVANDAAVAQAGAGGEAVDLVVGTVSACHGALSRLRIPPPTLPAGTPGR